MKNQLHQWEDTVRRFRGATVGVVGDYMLDELLRGEATRISPEAPVPVVLFPPEAPRRDFPGGAGNVAANILALGGRPIPFGAIGRDRNGENLAKLLESRGVPCWTLLRVRGRATPRKVRIVAGQHQIVRLDFERAERISPATESQLARRILGGMKVFDALVISDYGKGSVTSELVAEITAAARQLRIPILVDPKPQHPEICRHATLVTPNLREAEMMAGHPMRTRDDLAAHGRRLRAELNCEHLLVTRGGKGMTLFEPNGELHDIPGEERPVFDVTGAGDTVIAVLALAAAAIRPRPSPRGTGRRKLKSRTWKFPVPEACGDPMRLAAELANLAASRVVLKFGTAEISSPELLAAIKDSGARNSSLRR
jgi:rfaE bifunctional protein kinase chain/domain